MEDPVSGPQPSPESGADRSSAPIRVVVDHREGGAGVLLALSGIEGVGVRVEHLPVGDYLVDDAFVFERKTLADLTASIKDARLFKQACRLAEDSRRAATSSGPLLASTPRRRLRFAGSCPSGRQGTWSSGGA